MRAIRSGELADRAFARLAADVPTRDRAWLQELVYGTLRLRGRLDYLLERYVKNGLSSLDDDVHDILRLGAYQLLEMGSVPAYAAVSQSVELAKRERRRAASGLVNGVLQSLRRGGVPEPPSADQSQRLVQWESHPRWLVERWIAHFGTAETKRLLAANNQRPELFIRPLGISVAAAQTRLRERGTEAEPLESAPDALRIVNGAPVPEILAAVPAVVQDPAAGLVARYAELSTGVIADVCAAPGGKALAIAAQILARAAEERGIDRVFASDLSAQRLQRAIENAQRIGGLPISFLVADARRPAFKSVDAVLLDAPCTGTGTFRRHPDGKWRIGPEDLSSLIVLQEELLDAAARTVKRGGVLVYSTCSLEPEENQQQIEKFLQRHADYRLAAPRKWHDSTLLDEQGRLVVLPQRHGFDGAFAARLERM